jgi:hypothetical protein
MRSRAGRSLEQPGVLSIRAHQNQKSVEGGLKHCSFRKAFVTHGNAFCYRGQGMLKISAPSPYKNTYFFFLTAVTFVVFIVRFSSLFPACRQLTL